MVRYAIIGMCVLDRAQARVQAFMMSCRVQRKASPNGSG
jgi:hypothetical protein